jgi:NAD-dependent dihydropyrimidine dehydrogenase PreA subunit
LDRLVRVNSMSEETFHGIPRNKIPWYPTINYEKCVSCGKCVDFCKHGVYAFEEKQGKKMSVVTNPYSCVVLCIGCEPICAGNAITHPSRKETVELIRKLKKR